MGRSAATETSEIRYFKKRSRELKRRLQSIGVALTLQQALEGVAAEEGFKNWAALLASRSSSPPATREDGSAALLEDIRPTFKSFASRAIEDLAVRHHEGRRSLLVAITGSSLAERSEVAHVLGQHLGQYVSIFKQGPLPKYKTLESDFLRRSVESARKLGGHVTYIEGLHHLLATTDPQALAEGREFLSGAAAIIRDLPAASAIFLGISEMALLPRELAALPFIEISLPMIKGSGLHDVLEADPNGLKGSCTPGLRDEVEDEKTWRSRLCLPFNAELP